ncbi:MAG: hypothetical protein AAF495_26085 [Pseudomonadota bacterium]
MNQRVSFRRRGFAASSVAALTGLALLIQPGLMSSAAAQGGMESPATVQQIQGRLVNQTVDKDCIGQDGTRVCAVDITGYAISNDGERIDRRIVASALGSAREPGDLAPNRSYAIWTYPDGSTMLTRSQGASTVKADGQRITSGVETCVAGTGRFADVDCTIDWQHTPQPDGLYAGTYSGTMTPKTPS